MKVNKITFSQIKLRWQIQQMTSAYIHAEQQIIKKLADGIDITGANEIIQEVQQNAKTITPKDKLLEQEKYELFIELKEIYEKYKQEYDRL